eukprot:1073332-Rhodomonas_salina.3
MVLPPGSWARSLDAPNLWPSRPQPGVKAPHANACLQTANGTDTGHGWCDQKNFSVMSQEIAAVARAHIAVR